MVRNQLQEELLRLQREIGKTIVFVTHDIDEAIKLGDHVAGLRVGGVLAPFAPPAELLAHPADEFVESFIGKDRGYRALTFMQAHGVDLQPVPDSLELGSPGRHLSWLYGSDPLPARARVRRH